MTSYYYKALNQNDALLAGELQAETVLAAITELESRGLRVQSIGLTPPDSTVGSGEFSGPESSQAIVLAAVPSSPMTSQDAQAVLQPHIDGVLQKKASILPALRVLAEEIQPGRTRRQMDSLIRVIEENDLTKAMRTFEELSDYWMPLLATVANETEPEKLLQGYVERAIPAGELRRQWWSVLAYPLLVACLAIGVFVGISFLIVPTFQDIFDDFQLDLPAMTIALLSVSESVRSDFVLVYLVGFLVAGFLAYLVNRLLPDSAVAILGQLVPFRFGRATSTGKLLQFSADLLEAGFSVPDALQIAGLATNRRYLRIATRRLSHAMRSNGVSQHRTEKRSLTSTLVHVLRAEMASESRIRLLREISQCHAERARARLWTEGIVGPAAMCAIGLVVGWTLLALCLPLISLVSSLS